MDFVYVTECSCLARTRCFAHSYESQTMKTVSAAASAEGVVLVDCEVCGRRLATRTSPICAIAICDLCYAGGTRCMCHWQEVGGDAGAPLRCYGNLTACESLPFKCLEREFGVVFDLRGAFPIGLGCFCVRLFDGLTWIVNVVSIEGCSVWSHRE